MKFSMDMFARISALHSLTSLIAKVCAPSLILCNYAMVTIVTGVDGLA